MIVTAALSAMNVAFYVGGGHHWWNAAAAVFCGLLAVACAIEDAAA